MRLQRFLAVLKARNIEFVRDRTALAWNIVMPILLVAGFAFLFSKESDAGLMVGVHGVKDKAEISRLATKYKILSTRYITFVPLTDLAIGLDKLRHHKLHMVLSLDEHKRYWINSDSQQGYMLERVLRGSADTAISSNRFEKQTVSGRRIRYVDFVLPGILAMNMMFSCLFGIGFVIVRYRKNGVLKRFKATPISVFEFVTAQIVSRLIIIMCVTVLVFAGCNLFIGFDVAGNYFTLFLVYLVGAFSIISLALIVAARSTSEEYANGVLNLFSWPMLIFSGVWFSLEGLHPSAQAFAQALPLTHVIDAARAVMNDGANLLQVMPQLGILLLMSLVFLAVGSLRFRWENR